jgi:hypothetical protein
MATPLDSIDDFPASSSVLEVELLLIYLLQVSYAEITDTELALAKLKLFT